MSGLWGRIFGYFFNQVFVETLSNSKSFQRFAVRTNARIQEIKTNRAAMIQEHAENASGLRFRAFSLFSQKCGKRVLLVVQSTRAS
jgi:hypothetical protein